MSNLLSKMKKIGEVPRHKKAVSAVATNSILLKPFFDTRKYYYYYTEVQREKGG